MQKARERGREETPNGKSEMENFHSNRLYSAHIRTYFMHGLYALFDFGKFAIDVIHKVFVTFTHTSASESASSQTPIFGAANGNIGKNWNRLNQIDQQ